MLVVQRSVVAAEEGEVEHPSDMLDEMRERFMVRGSRTAFDWACRLRSYAKKVVSNTTSLGYIAWSEDGSSVTYKDTGFSMEALRKFIAKIYAHLERTLSVFYNQLLPAVVYHRKIPLPSASPHQNPRLLPCSWSLAEENLSFGIKQHMSRKAKKVKCCSVLLLLR